MSPSFYATHYRSGEEIRAGDRILWAGRPGTVVFVLGSPDIPADWIAVATWLGKTDPVGFMLDTEVGGLVFQKESDEDLDFLARQVW
jgi:hypothetical protein